MSVETHPFEQNPEAAQVQVCVCRCGKWPDHHVHTGDRSMCGCDDCAEVRVVIDPASWPSDVPRLLRQVHVSASGSAVRCVTSGERES